MGTYFVSWYEEPFKLVNDTYQFIFTTVERENSIGSFQSNGLDLAGDSWPMMMDIKDIHKHSVAFFYDL